MKAGAAIPDCFPSYRKICKMEIANLIIIKILMT
jgi:hypothetical protein